jgi:hypothetical protein
MKISPMHGDRLHKVRKILFSPQAKKEEENR